MFDVGESLRGALDGARTDLLNAQSSVARAGAARGGRLAGSAMAAAARAAIFTEALLEAERARFAEIKAVAK